jgi:hypothetical protein
MDNFYYLPTNSYLSEVHMYPNNIFLENAEAKNGYAKLEAKSSYLFMISWSFFLLILLYAVTSLSL